MIPFYDHFVPPPHMKELDVRFVGRELALFTFFLSVMQNCDGFSFDMELEELCYLFRIPYDERAEGMFKTVSSAIDAEEFDVGGRKMKVFSYIRCSSHVFHVAFNRDYEAWLNGFGESIKVYRHDFALKNQQ